MEQDAAAGAARTGEAPGRDELRLLPLSLVDLRADQPRRRSRDAAQRELTRSVAALGVLQPIRVRRAGARFEVVSGERRLRAARAAGLSDIPAVVVDRDDEAALVESLIENVEREDLSLIDRAAAIRRLRASWGLASWEAVAERLGMSRGHLHRLLALTRLPQAMQEDPRFTSLTEKHVRALRRLDGHPDTQHALWEQMHAATMSGEAALAAAAAMLRDAESSASDSVARLRTAAAGFIEALSRLEQNATPQVRAELLQVRGLIDASVRPPRA